MSQHFSGLLLVHRLSLIFGYYDYKHSKAMSFQEFQNLIEVRAALI